MSWSFVWEHLFLVFAAGVLSILLGLPLGIAAYLLPSLRKVILRIVDLLQTIPALALLGIIMVFCGAGKVTVIIGITLYSLLPIVRNTLVGLQEVDPGIKEAARGMGMTQAYRLMAVELPMAFPTIFTGVRIALVNAIGTAVFAAFVGGGGIGGILTRGIRIQDTGLIYKGTLVLMVIALLLDWGMGTFENFVQRTKRGVGKKLWGSIAVMALLLCLVLPFGLRGDDTSRTLVLYDGDYSETQVMHHMVKHLVEAHTDLDVVIKDQMTQVNNFKTMTGDKPSCDLMLSYDGTVLTTFLHQDPEDVPAGMSLYDYANSEVGREHGLKQLEKLGFDNTYAVAVPENLAREKHLETVSDLIPLAPELAFGAEHDFFTQEGSMKYGPFTEFYGLHFKDSIPVDVSLKYAAIENGSYQVTEVFATDGLNRKAKLKVLKDDRKFFPDYNGCFLVRKDALERLEPVAPDLEKVLNSLAGKISNDDMVGMTYRIDVEGQDIDTVAKDFLREKGLL